MSAIFPAAARGGVPPGPSICNGYDPEHHVIGEGPLYVAPDCTTFLTDCQLNSLASEILAAVDRLGFAFNANRVNNLGEALVSKFEALEAALNDRVMRAGDTMTGPLEVICPPANDNDAACKKYVDDTIVDCCEEAQQNIDDAISGFQTQLDGKVNRTGDYMTGPLFLSGDPTLPGHAVTLNYLQTIESQLQSEINDRVRRDGDAMTGPLFLAHDPTSDLEAATKHYVDQIGAVPPADIPLVIISPTTPLPTRPGRLWWNSATGQLFIRYADDLSEQWVGLTAPTGGPGGVPGGNFLPLSGGTLSGPLFLSGAPTVANGAATKAYVDSQIALGGTFVDAPADGELYGRQDNAWVQVTTALGIDGGVY